MLLSNPQGYLRLKLKNYNLLKEIKNFVLRNPIVYAEGKDIDIHVTTLGKIEIRDFKSVGGSEIRIIKLIIS